MNQSESITELAKALLIFHKEVGKVSKDATNPFFKNRYASLSNIIEAIEAPLQKAGLSVIQLPSGENGVSTRLIHETGEWIEDTYTMPVKEAHNPQAVGSSITYGRRYALASLLMLNVDDDDDGNAASTPKNINFGEPDKMPARSFTHHQTDSPDKEVLQFTVNKIDTLTSKGGKTYAKMDTSLGSVIAWSNTMKSFETGEEYHAPLKKETKQDGSVGYIVDGFPTDIVKLDGGNLPDQDKLINVEDIPF